ncbi:MAG TPA: AsmA family protein [Dongiaceae bacterium]|nr:AsmA family protein [Dongiaceae bacterium]
MRKVLWIVGGLIGLLIVAALVAPFFVDLNNYKAEIAQKAKEATGRDLAIDGDISLSILPTPGVTVHGVRFGNAPGGSQPDMATLESATVKVALLPLLSKKVEVEEVVLEKPTFVFEKLKDGSGNWQIAPEAEAPEAGVTPAPGSASSSGGGMAVVIKSASIVGGTLIYRDLAAGTEQKVENLNIDLSLDSLTGPFQAEGGATVVNIPLGFRVKTGALDQNAPMPVDVSFSLTDAKATIGFVGAVNIAAVEDPTKPIVTGKLSSKGEDLAKLIAGMPNQSAEGLPPIMSQAFAVEADIEAGKTSAKTENFTANLGDLSAKANIAAKYATAPDVQAKIAIGRIDLDKLLPAGEPKNESTTTTTTSNASAPAQPAAPFALPADVTAGVDVTVQQIVYKGQAIDDSSVSMQLANGEFKLKNASAKLPGSSSIAAAGTLVAANGQPNFTGTLKANSGNLRALIDAFAPGAVKDVPGDRLRQLALNTAVKYNPAQAELADLKVTLDQSAITGGVKVALPDGAQRKQPGFGVALAIDKLNLDGYMPSPSAKPAEPAASEAKNEQGGNPLKALAPLADYSANVDLKVGALTLNDQQISGLHLAAGVANGTLDVKELSVADFQGGKANVAAKVTDLKGDPKFDSTFDVTAKDAGRVLQMAGMGPQPKGKFGALTLKGTAAGTPTDVTFDVTTAMAGIGFQGAAKGTASGIGAGIPKINSTFDIKANDLGPLADLAGAPADAAKNLGAVSFSGQAQSGADDLTYDVALAMSGIGGKGTLKGKVAGLSKTPQIDTALNLSADKPAPLLQLAGIAGPKAKSVGALGIAGTLKGSAENMALDLNLNGLGGTAKVTGTVQAPKGKDPNNPPPIGFDIALSADHPEFTQLLQMADIQSSGVKAGPLKVSLKTSGTTKKASVSNLNAAWGNSSITGTASYDATGAKPTIVANLKGGVVNLTPFMGGGSSSSGGGAPAGAGGKGGSPWSEEPLDLSALRNQDADIDFTAQSLIMPSQQIDNLVAKITLRNGVLSMQTLNGKIYGGGFDLSGTTVDGSQQAAKIDAKVKVDQVQVGQVLGGGIAGNQIKGPLSLNLDATGAGESQAALVRSLAGNGNLDGTIMIIGKMEQQVGSALLGVLGAKVKAVQGVTSAVNGIVSSYTGVDNKLGGTFNIKQGVLDTQDFAFANPRARGTAKGQVDLGAWVMNMLIDLFGADAQQAFMSINLDGPVDGPTPKFASNGAAGPAGLMGLGQNGAFNPGGLVQEIPGLKKLPGIGNLLGGQGAPATGTEGQPGAAIPGVGNAPAVNLPGVGNVLGGQSGQGQQQQQQPGGLLPGVGDLLGGSKKKKEQKQEQPAEPGTVEPGAALPGTGEQAPTTQVPAEQPQPEQQQAEPGAAEPGAAPPGGGEQQQQQQPGIIIPGVKIPGVTN